jgi:YVTN family beta-propeller protein
MNRWLAVVALLALRPHASAPPSLVYVANQAAGKISVLDAATDSVVATVDLPALGFSAHPKPHHIAVEPDGSFWYVSLVGDNVVVKFDRDNRVVAKAQMETPGLLALDPTSDRLFVTRSMTAVNAPPRIAVIRRTDMSLEEVEVLLPRPHAVTSGPDGHYAYVASISTNQLATYDVRRERVEVTDVRVEGGGERDSALAIVQLAVSPDGKTLVATAQLPGKLLVFDLADPAKPRLTRSVSVGGGGGAWPWYPAFTPDGREVWVTNQRSNDVTVVDAATWKAVATVSSPGFAQPDGIVITADGRYAFVSNHNGPMPGMTMSHAAPMPAAPTPAAGGVPPAPGRVVMIDVKRRAALRVTETAPDAAGIGIGGRSTQ